MANLGSITQASTGRQIFCSLLEAVPVFSQTYRAAGLQVLICLTSSHITELQNEGCFGLVCAVALVLAAFWLL